MKIFEWTFRNKFKFGVYVSIFTCMFVGCSRSRTQSERQDISTKNQNGKPQNSLAIRDDNKSDTLISLGRDGQYRVRIEVTQLDNIVEGGENDKAAKVTILKNSDIIYSRSFTKEYFKINEKEFIKKAVLHRLKFDKVDAENNINLFCSIAVPETDWTYAYRITIDKDGKQQVYEYDEEGNETLKTELK